MSERTVCIYGKSANLSKTVWRKSANLKILDNKLFSALRWRKKNAFRFVEGGKENTGIKSYLL